MDIICPECNFSRTVPDEKVPPTAEVATCPKCKAKFRFRTLSKPADFQEQLAQEQADRPAPQKPAPRPETPPAGPTVASDFGAGRPESRPETPPQVPEMPGHTPPAAPDMHAEAPREEDASPMGARLPYENNEDYIQLPRPRIPGQKPGQQPQGDVFAGLERMGDGDRARQGREAYKQTADDAEGEYYEEDVPWERLDAYGFFPGLMATLKRAMLRPVRFFATMPVGQGILRPLVFYVLLSLFSTVVSTAFNILGVTMLTNFFPQGEAMPGGAEFMGMGAASVMNLLLVPVFSAIFLFIWAGVMHLFLTVFQAANRGYEATFRAVAYGSAPTILVVIPILGWLVAGFWALAITFIGLKEIHRTSYTRVLLAFAVMLVLFFGLMIYIFHAAFSALQ